ncbi:hypothetical protein ACWF94_40150 [Streptomyces sp. NPDC055078]
MTAEPRYDRADPGRTGTALVNHQLGRLGLGETYTTRDGIAYRALPEGAGWCRADGVPEPAWPRGADLCVLVNWYPDAAFRRDDTTGKVPEGAEQHWAERVAATAVALESIGYVAEETGPPRTPHHHANAELLVYRMPQGVPPRRQPADAWKGWPPARPNWISGHYRYPGIAPDSEIHRVLQDAKLTWEEPYYAEPRVESGPCFVQSITQTLWPPGSSRCALVVWQPAAGFRRSTKTGDVPPGAAEHWASGTARVVDVLEQNGYRVTGRERPLSPARDTTAEFLVHRTEHTLTSAIGNHTG